MLNKIKSILLTFIIFLFPLFFLPITQDYFSTNKLYLLSSGAILLLLISTIEILLTKKIVFHKQVKDIFPFIFAVAVFSSIIITSPNRVQAILNPNFGLWQILTLSFISIYFRERGQKVITALSLSSLLLSAIAIFFFFRQSNFFSPLGRRTDLAVFLGFTLIFQLMQILTNMDSSATIAKLLSKITFALTLAGFIISVNFLLPKPFPDLPPLSYSWKATKEIFKTPQSAIFGIGVDNYASIFTKIKDAVYNQSNFWQISSFNLNRSTILHILTESGLFGLISFFLLFLFFATELVKKNKLMIILIVYLTFVFFIFPPSLTLFFIFYLILLGGASGRDPTSAQDSDSREYRNNEAEQYSERYYIRSKSKSEHLWEGNLRGNLTKSDYKIDLKRSPILFLIPLCIFILLVITSYFLGRTYLAEYYFKKSLDALAKKQNIKTVYDNQRLAVLSNPYIERFRVTFSQTNLLIANNIASRRNTSKVNELSKQDRQTITQAMQAAIEEAKAAIKLNDQKATNWENLALVYRNLIGTAQGADAWTISSYQRAILLDPQNPTYRLNLGGVYFAQGKFAEAKRFFEQAVILKPDWPNAHYNLAWTLYQKNDIKRAVLEMETVIKLLNSKKDAADLEKAQKELEEFKTKL